ncbi:MAG: Lrp/AsnC family transcriptional regulator [Candidatus Woesearchaeota archaeon]
MRKSEQLTKINIDERDKKILRTLLENAKLSYRQISKKLLVSVATVMHRIDKLEEQGIIQKYTAKLDYQKLGFDLVVCVDIRVAKGKLFEVERLIAKHPSVQAVYDLTGSFDCLVIAKFKNRRELDNFVKKIQTYDFVERTETRLVLNIIKEDVIDNI